MRRKRPAFLPGKELAEIHFEPFAAAELTPEEIGAECAALWQLAASRRWASAGEIKTLQTAAEKKTSGEVWGAISEWGQKINWSRPEESAGAAGWVLLRNIDRARQIWKTFRRPYMGLRSRSPESFIRALQLACAFEGSLEENLKEGERHLLALVILLLGRRDLDALGREAIGGASIGSTGPDKLLAISHGIKSSDGKGWIRADLPTVRAISQRLEKSLPHQQQTRINFWRKKLSGSASQ